jgi:hypothetical protein
MRKLAPLQLVKHVRPIPGADYIEAIGVLGWQCVAKKGEFREGDPCVSFEIDSLLPEQPRYEFLRQSSFKPDLGRFKLRTGGHVTPSPGFHPGAPCAWSRNDRPIGDGTATLRRRRLCGAR